MFSDIKFQVILHDEIEIVIQEEVPTLLLPSAIARAEFCFSDDWARKGDQTAYITGYVDTDDDVMTQEERRLR